MQYLLDTNILVFMLSAPNELSEEAKRIIRSEPELFVSMASQLRKWLVELSLSEVYYTNFPR